MVDCHELMTILSVPRPNGSAALQRTCRTLQEWLSQRGIPYRLHTFRLYPYFFEAIGVWIILSRTLLAAAIWLRWGWLAMLIAILGVIGGTLDVVLNLPIVTWPGAQRGENILIEFEPPAGASQEIVFSAHYDSKTELLDHFQRMFFVTKLRFGIVLTLLLGFLGLAEGSLQAQAPTYANLVFGLGVALTLPMLFLAFGLGLNLSTGRLLQPSQGAVDDGAACAILLGLADRLAKGEVAPQRTRVTLALFTGEEVNMQGSRAYTRDREWPLPAVALNLEVMAQDGGYIFWEQDGNAFGLTPTSPEVSAAIADAAKQVTGQPARPAGPVNSDGFSFISASIPTGVLGTFDSRLQVFGFHRPTDNLGRVVMSRLPEGVEILSRFVDKCDRETIRLNNEFRIKRIRRFLNSLLCFA
jgi:hypothetical protein